MKALKLFVFFVCISIGNVFAETKFVGIIASTGYIAPPPEVKQSALVAAEKHADLINKFCSDLNILPIIIPEGGDDGKRYAGLIRGAIFAGGIKKPREEFAIQEEMSRNYILNGKANVNLDAIGIMPSKNNWISYNRDGFEFKFAKRVLGNMPVLGIDSGTHVVSIVMGASSSFILVPKKPLFFHAQLNSTHGAKILTNSKMYRFTKIDQISDLFSFHTKAIIVGNNSFIRAVAFSEDGIVEGVENSEGSLFIGIQWHPEESPQSPITYSIIRSFCEAL